MANQVEKCNMENILFTADTSNVKQRGYEENDLVDDKVHVSETAIIIDNVQLQNHATHYYVNNLSTIQDNIKTELSSPEVQYNIINDSFKKEEGISADDIKSEFDNRLLYCECCQTYYEEYCFKCGMLVHILNRNASNDTENRAQMELPNDILEIQDSFGRFGIFTLKSIPEGVTFGPFTGLSRTECPWQIKCGKFVLNKVQSKNLNWMQYINVTSNISELNLGVFQCGDNLYYQSTRLIPAGDELLVYFGAEYEDNLNKNSEVDFIPTIERFVKEVFACTFCCLGFSSRRYLAKHKTVCLWDTAKEFSIEELMECQFCSVRLDQKEYYEYHMAHCCEKNVRKCSPRTTPTNQTVTVRGRKTRPRSQMYKCERCKYRTKYKVDLKNHINQHYAVKTCKRGICDRRFKTKESCRLLEKNTHIYVGEKKDLDRSTGDCVNALIKAENLNSQDTVKQLKCSRCEFQTKHKYSLNIHTKTKHLNEFSYSCEACDYKTNRKDCLKTHTKRHLIEFSYNCDTCDYKTNRKDSLKRHTKRHLQEFSYRCDTCDYKTNSKDSLKTHKTRHLKEFSYRCDVCDFQTDDKHYLKTHTKTKHLKEFRYMCDICDYKTNIKDSLKTHTKTNHLKEFSYRCNICDYKTNNKLSFKTHTKTIHLKEFSYRCNTCDFKTNHKGYLGTHIKTKHTKDFYYSCEACDFKTNDKGHLEYHLKSKHLNEFNYKCDLCDFKTNRKLCSKTHTKTIHLKEFDYKCDSCDFKTNHKSKLEIHIKTIHLKEFNYKCDLCDYKTNGKTRLKTHIRTKHLKEFIYRCDLCDYKTNRKYSLKAHTKTIHLKEFDYGCDICDFKTNRKENFERHTRRKH